MLAAFGLPGIEDIWRLEKALAAYRRQQFDDSEPAVRTLLDDELVKVTLRRLIETSERALAEECLCPPTAVNGAPSTIVTGERPSAEA